MNLGQTESQFQSAIIELAEIHHWKIYHVSNVRRRLRSHSSEGFPDLVLVKNRVIYAELKKETETPSEEQESWLEALVRANQIAYVWRPSDWDFIAEILKT